jgi:hypothetical protein
LTPASDGSIQHCSFSMMSLASMYSKAMVLPPVESRHQSELMRLRVDLGLDEDTEASPRICCCVLGNLFGDLVVEGRFNRSRSLSSLLYPCLLTTIFTCQGSLKRQSQWSSMDFDIPNPLVLPRTKLWTAEMSRTVSQILSVSPWQ